MLVGDSATERSHVDAAERGAIHIALLGLGQVGSAVVRLADADSGRSVPFRVSAALVRTECGRTSRYPFPLTSDVTALLASNPDVVIEVLGGTEPARTFVLQALGRGIPVVTANKTLLAVHGDELFAAAEESNVSLKCEAAVIAGVPFLGPLQRRPHARAVRRLAGVLNGTTNFILSQLEAGARTLDEALLDAQRLGFAEPDPSKDLNGGDAAEKLAVLLRHLGGLSVLPADIPTTGLNDIARGDLEHAREFGGTIKLVATADWTEGNPVAFVGPAFVPLTDPLSTLTGVLNGIRLHGRSDLPLFFSGPGAGPDVTAATILDDVIETASGGEIPQPVRARRVRVERSSHSAWFVRLQSSTRLPSRIDIADLFASYGVWIHRSSKLDTREGDGRVWLLIHPCSRFSVTAACAALSAVDECNATIWHSLEVESE